MEAVSHPAAYQICSLFLAPHRYHIVHVAYDWRSSTKPCVVVNKRGGLEVRIPLSHFDALVPKDFLQLEQVATLQDPPARESVAEIMEVNVPSQFASAGDSRKVCAVEHAVQHLLKDAGGFLEHTSIAISEHQSAWVLQAPISEEWQQCVEDWYEPDLITFRRTIKRALHGDQPSRPIDVSPL